MKPTDVTEFITSLDAGVFEKKLSAAISEISAAVSSDEKTKAGKLIITLKFNRIGASSQVNIVHKLSTSRPTLRGQIVQDDTTETPMYVGPGGETTLFPPNQEQLFPINKG